MRKLVVLVALVALLVAGDFFIKKVAEKRVADELQSSFGGSGVADVEFGGFPFTARLMAGSIPVTRVSSPSLERDGVKLTDIRMTLQDLEFSLAKIRSGEMESVSVRDGHGRASLKPTALTKVFAALNSSIVLDLRGGELRAKVGPVEGTSELSIDGTNLVLSVPGLDRALTVELPEFIGGMQYRSVRIDGRQVIIEFSLEDASFEQ